MNKTIKMSLWMYSSVLLCSTSTPVYSTEKMGYRWVCNRSVFSSGSIDDKWKDDGINGRYSPRSILPIVKQLRKNEYDINSMLGCGRCYFIWQQNINYLPFLSKDNIRGDAMKMFYENRVNKIKSDIKVSDEEARKLAFVVCSNVSWGECRRIFGDFLGNRDNKYTLSMGLTHKYTLEEAYIILHIRPSYWFWGGPTTKELEMYTNLIAGALNAVTQGGASSNITLDENFSREETLRSIIRAFFDKFISKKNGDVRS